MAAEQQLITDSLPIWSSAIKTKSAAGRGKSNKLELYGIKMLRELILELAVRGLLVPQHSNDEPASVLLKRIATEKAKLVKDGKIKKQKALSQIEEDEKPFELPDGWAWARLAQISTANTGYAFKSSKYTESGTFVLRVTNINQDGSINLVDTKYIDPGSANIEYKKFGLVADDVLLVMVGGSLGKIGIVSENVLPAVLNQNMWKLNRYGGIQTEYFVAGLRFVNNNQLTITKSTHGHLAQGVYMEKLFPLPPQNEQVRIVAKLAELIVLCDQLEQQQEISITAHQTLVQTMLDALTTASERDGFIAAWARIADHFDTLFTTEWSIDQLKQTILQLAVMGKLVPQDPYDEPASELLKKIAAEKAKVGKAEKNKKQKALPRFEGCEKSPELPERWEWCRLQDLITKMDAGWSPACPPYPSPSDDIWGVLKTTAVQTLEFRQKENKVLADGEEPRPQYEVGAGDILITRAGPKNRVGISCLVQKTRRKLMISDKIIRCHLVELGLSERYISLCLNAGTTAQYLESAKSGMAESQMNISQHKLKAAPIPLAPLNEQQLIVEMVDRLMDICAKLKVRISTAQATQLKLADALAEKALL